MQFLFFIIFLYSALAFSYLIAQLVEGALYYAAHLGRQSVLRQMLQYWDQGTVEAAWDQQQQQQQEQGAAQEDEDEVHVHCVV